MSLKDEQILRTAKEVVVKYIEIGRLSPQNFPDSFREIYTAIDETVRQHRRKPTQAADDQTS